MGDIPSTWCLVHPTNFDQPKHNRGILDWINVSPSCRISKICCSCCCCFCVFFYLKKPNKKNKKKQKSYWRLVCKNEQKLTTSGEPTQPESKSRTKCWLLMLSTLTSVIHLEKAIGGVTLLEFGFTFVRVKYWEPMVELGQCSWIVC